MKRRCIHRYCMSRKVEEGPPKESNSKVDNSSNSKGG
eukprot:CAMPEP_0183733214 /NCGR_PEP_ID=MMETSP0737-20130205/40510_1 /TAXON_ID=385413 /ORGANISM="Thalassiosira miniscula, Strain CCMP1093" /LENGTH=36 /DNA_ID= /DNA_START= /DNA_END= /DNA_ORIENTATION=